MFRTFIKSQVLFWMSISKLWGHPLDSSPSLSLSFLGYREWIKGGGGGGGGGGGDMRILIGLNFDCEESLSAG